MVKGKKLTELEQGEILAFRSEGDSLETIRNKIGRSKHAVYNFLKDPKQCNNKNRGGRPKIITPATGRRLLRTLNHEKKLSASKLVQRLHLSCSTDTVRRFLKKDNKK